MKKKLTVKRGTIPPKITDFEHDLIDSSIYLPGWQFESTILPYCVFIEEPIVEGYYSKTEEGEKPSYKSVIIYALLGFDSKNKERCIANYFVRNGDYLFQVDDIEQANRIVSIMRKEWKWLRYRETKEKENKKVA